MNYTDALKTVKASTKVTAENFMCIKISYDKTLILPYSQGLAFMASLAQAELLQNGYDEAPRIKHADEDSITVSMMSRKSYEHFKIAGLLGLDKNQHREMVEAANNPAQEEATA